MRRVWSVLFAIVASVGLASVVLVGVSVRTDARTRPFPSVPFVVGCGVSHEANDDPIIHPGMAGASHRHVFFGNTSTHAGSTVESLKRGSTSCDDKGDLASYWLPGLANGATWTNMRAYYIAGGVSPASVKSFPLGLQIVAGWKFDERGAGTPSVTWSCGLLADQSGWVSSAPSNCPSRVNVAVRVDFPQCWDGKHLNAPGNMWRSVNGSCPQTFPIALPMLRIRAEVRGAASGLTSGGLETMHADFWNAWDAKRLDLLVATCIRGERAVQREVRRCGVPGGGPKKP